MNHDASDTKIKVYEIQTIKLHLDGRFATRDGEPIDPPLTSKEFTLIWGMAAETFRQPLKQFTVEEVWLAGWPEEKNYRRTEELDKSIANKVSKNLSNIRGKLKEILPERGFYLIGSVRDATPPESPFLVAHRIFVACSITAVATVSVDTIARACLAACGWTIAQSEKMGVVLGFFQGVIGSLTWSIGISAPLLFLWFVIDKFNPWRRTFAWLRGVAVGTLAGLLGGLIISFACLWAQYQTSLVQADWMLSVSDSKWTAFTVTRLAYSEPWFGAIIGGIIALTVLIITSRRAWSEFLEKNPKLVSLSAFWRVVTEIVKMTIRWGSVLIVPQMLIGAALFMMWLPRLPKQIPAGRVFGEAACIAIGGMAFVAGLLTALYSLTKGVDVAGERKCSLARVETTWTAIT